MNKKQTPEQSLPTFIKQMRKIFLAPDGWVVKMGKQKSGSYKVTFTTTLTGVESIKEFPRKVRNLAMAGDPNLINDAESYRSIKAVITKLIR